MCSVYGFPDYGLAIVRVGALELVEQLEPYSVMVEEVHEEVATHEMATGAVLDEVPELHNVDRIRR